MQKERTIATKKPLGTHDAKVQKVDKKPQPNSNGLFPRVRDAQKNTGILDLDVSDVQDIKLLKNEK